MNDVEFDEERDDRREGWLALEQFLAAHAALDEWCTQHPQDAGAVRAALNELARLRREIARAA